MKNLKRLFSKKSQSKDLNIEAFNAYANAPTLQEMALLVAQHPELATNPAYARMLEDVSNTTDASEAFQKAFKIKSDFLKSSAESIQKMK